MVDLKLQLPDGFLNEEVRCGYTVTKQRKEVWAVELDLLQEFMRVCNKCSNCKICESLWGRQKARYKGNEPIYG